ncbi:MAG: hemolysin III family protein [Anaerovoracaceae bacterium]|mgnify:CR=1 FL=1|nr:hemolysin III family protein [Clostridiales bacterium]
MKLREPVNAVTHFLGAFIFLVGGIFMVIYQTHNNTSLIIMTGGIIFSAGLVMLYSSSGIYHGYSGKEEVIKVLKKLDHAMIYVLIAASYTPLCLFVLTGQKRLVILVILWAIVVIGVVTKLLIRRIPRPVSTSLYLVMGWIVIFFIKDVILSLPAKGFLFLLAGGILYTAGGIIYMIKKPNIWKRVGFHELFHILVLTGSCSHYLLVLFYLG